VSVARAAMYVWEPFVEDFLAVGWLLGAFYAERGEYGSYVMLWLCDCKPVVPRARQRWQGDAA
jgi:hypothetical protein